MSQDGSDWIEWAGGECPVADDVFVTVRIRDRAKCRASGETAEAYTWSWAHIPEDAGQDIIAYRLAEEQPK